MSYLNGSSLRILSDCTTGLQHLAQEVIKSIDFTITQGYLGEKGNETTCEFPDSPQNACPSKALRFIPSPYTGIKDFKKFEAIINVFRAKAAKLGIEIMAGDEHWDHPGIILIK